MGELGGRYLVEIKKGLILLLQISSVRISIPCSFKIMFNQYLVACLLFAITAVNRLQ